MLGTGGASAGVVSATTRTDGTSASVSTSARYAAARAAARGSAAESALLSSRFSSPARVSARVKPGSVSPLPEGVDTLNFPVDQTYSDGKVVKWNEPVPASGAEPEHPAPQLKLVADSNDQAPAAASADNLSDTVARLLAAAGLVLGLAALILVVRRRAPQ